MSLCRMRPSSCESRIVGESKTPLGGESPQGGGGERALSRSTLCGDSLASRPVGLDPPVLDPFAPSHLGFLLQRASSCPARCEGTGFPKQVSWRTPLRRTRSD